MRQNGNDFIPHPLQVRFFISAASHENDGYAIQALRDRNHVGALHTDMHRLHLHVVEFQFNVPRHCVRASVRLLQCITVDTQMKEHED